MNKSKIIIYVNGIRIYVKKLMWMTESQWRKSNQCSEICHLIFKSRSFSVIAFKTLDSNLDFYCFQWKWFKIKSYAIISFCFCLELYTRWPFSLRPPYMVVLAEAFDWLSRHIRHTRNSTFMNTRQMPLILIQLNEKTKQKQFFWRDCYLNYTVIA